jgi:hypothetical protein
MVRVSAFGTKNRGFVSPPGYKVLGNFCCDRYSGSMWIWRKYMT